MWFLVSLTLHCTDNYNPCKQWVEGSVFPPLVIITFLFALFWQAEGAEVKDVVEAGIMDAYLTKYWAIKLATNAAITVLRVDQVSFICRLYYAQHNFHRTTHW